MMPLLVGIAVLVVVAIVAAAVVRRGPAPAPAAVAAPPSVPASPVATLDELVRRLRALEAAAPLTSPGDVAGARALYEEAMVLAESSEGRWDACNAALERLVRSRQAKHGSGLAEAGFAELLRRAAAAHPGPGAALALEVALEYAQKATAQNSMEGEAWVAYATSLVAAGSVDDGIAVMSDHGAYGGYRMHRARADAAEAKGDRAAAAGHLEKALAGAPEGAAREALERRLAGVRAGG